MTKRALPLALVTLWAAALYGSSATQPAFQGAEVTLQKIEPFTYVCLPVKGTYGQIQEAIGQLTLAMQMQRGAPTGPLVGIFYNNPEKVDSQDLQWEIGFPITPRQGVEPPLVLKEWKYAQVAVSMHKGPHAEVGKTIVKITEWMDANGFAPAGPVLERYFDMNPAEMRPEDLRTEIWIPCQKK